MNYAKARGDLRAFIYFSRNTHVRQRRKFDEAMTKMSEAGIQAQRAGLLLRNAAIKAGFSFGELSETLKKFRL